MSYESLEISSLASPVELFFFQRGGECWPYTSADSPQLLNGKTYKPVTVTRGAFERNDEAGSSTVQVQLDRTLKVVDQFLDGSGPSPVNLTIFRRHRSDAEYVVIFKGVVANAELTGEEVSLQCVSPLSSQEKQIPRELILRTCPHVLYGNRCLLNPTHWGQTGYVHHFSGSIPVIYDASGPDTEYFVAGVAYHTASGQRLFILSQTGSINPGIITLSSPIGWAVNDEVILYPGCDRVHSTCRDKFDNIANFGGFPLHPERNPFISLKGS